MKRWINSTICSEMLLFREVGVWVLWKEEEGSTDCGDSNATRHGSTDLSTYVGVPTKTKFPAKFQLDKSFPPSRAGDCPPLQPSTPGSYSEGEGDDGQGVTPVVGVPIIGGASWPFTFIQDTIHTPYRYRDSY